MKNKLKIYIYVSLCLVFLLLYACSAPQPVLPASFTVLTLKVSPQQVLTGAEVTVTAEVVNKGGLPGNFDEPLLVNGKQAATRVITIQPDYSKTVTYTITQNKVGKYTVQLGDKSATLVVTGMVEKDVELKYDNDKSEDALWAGNNGGHLVRFDPPSKPFAVDKVRICGGLYGTAWEGKTFELFILDKDMKSVVYSQVYAIAKFPVRGAFPYLPPQWVDFDIPVTSFNDKFYVYLYTSMTKHHGIQIGIDDSEINEHSSLAQGKPPFIVIVEPTTQYLPSVWYSNIDKLNWMIRVAGTALVPE